MSHEQESSIVSIEQKMLDDWLLRMPDGTEIEFQFPPRIPQDSRTGEWQEKVKPAPEPFAKFIGPTARTLTLEWTYIIDFDDNFTVDKVTDQLKAIRNYFYEGVNESGKKSVVKVKFAAHGGDEEMSARLEDLSIKHGSAYIKSFGSVSSFHPLRTDISVTVKLWTQDGNKQAKLGLEKKLIGKWI